MKKIFALVCTTALLLAALTACGQKNAPSSGAGSAAAGAKKVTIGLIQLVEHPSLDEIRTAIVAELEASAAEYGLDITIDYQNAQNDMSLISSINRQFVNDKVDCIIAIATPTAQGAATATADIPIIFSAVTDPLAANLVTSLEKPDSNVTGTSDAIDIEEIFALADQLTPGIQKYGFIYNKGETNSNSVIQRAKEYLDSRNIAYEEKTVTNTSEVQQTSRALLETCDAIFAPIDNTVASAMRVLADEGIAAGKPVYVAADSMVNDGGLATVGVNYTQLGKQTAGMALRALSGTPISQLPVEVLTETSVVINEETAKALGIDTSAFKK